MPLCRQLEVEPGNCNKYYASYKVTAWEDTWTHRRRRLRQERHASGSGLSTPTTTATSDLEPSPASADLTHSPTPDRAHSLDSSVASDTSDLSCRTGDSEPPAGKRSRSVSGDQATEGDVQPASKKPCLESALSQVTLRERRRHPALVFTLFVQRKGSDILLQLQLYGGDLGSDGVNGVVMFLRKKLQARLAVLTTTSGGGGGRSAGGVSSAAVTEGMGRVFGRLRTQMRQKLSLPPAAGSEKAEEAVSEGQPDREGAGSATEGTEAAGEVFGTTEQAAGDAADM